MLALLKEVNESQRIKIIFHKCAVNLDEKTIILKRLVVDFAKNSLQGGNISSVSAETYTLAL